VISTWNSPQRISVPKILPLLPLLKPLNVNPSAPNFSVIWFLFCCFHPSLWFQSGHIHYPFLLQRGTNPSRCDAYSSIKILFASLGWAWYGLVISSLIIYNTRLPNWLLLNPTSTTREKRIKTGFINNLAPVINRF
jgi:hypothetical protein